jgi:hypothetical protein
VLNAEVKKALDVALEDWSMMQKTAGDEGAEWAERFERNFYEFIDEFEKWFHTLDNQPKHLEEAEELKEVEEIQAILPGPLQLNFTMELERIIDGLETSRFD